MNSKKLVNYTGPETTVAVPTSVGGTLVREIATDAFDNTINTVVIDTYANDITGAPWGAQNVVWNKEPKCTITFDSNGGSGTMASRQANIGIAFTLPECTFIKACYHFEYWTLNSTTGSILMPGQQYAFSENATLYAHWSEWIPTIYQEVEYIGVTGSQYFQTTILPSATLGFKFKYYQPDAQPYSAIVCSYKYLTEPIYNMFGFRQRYTVWQTFRGVSGYREVLHTGFPNLVTVEFNWHNSGLCSIIDQNKVAKQVTLAPYENLDIPLYIFAEAPNVWCCGNGRIYGTLDFCNNQTLIAQLVPCYRRSDNIIGMYDRINGIFYTNQGSGTFLKGVDIN